MSITCPCQGRAAGGPFSCAPCQAKLAGRLALVPPVAKSTAAPVVLKPTPSPTPPAPALRVSLAGFSGYVLPDARCILGRNGMSPEGVRTLIHECGHAVMVYILGGTIVTVHPGPIRGRVDYEHTFTPRERIKVALGGWVLESLVTLSDSAPARLLANGNVADEERGLGDLLAVERGLDDLGIRDLGKRRIEVGTLAGETEVALVVNAKAVDALAYRLVCDPREQSGPTVHAILRTADPTAVAF